MPAGEDRRRSGITVAGAGAPLSVLFVGNSLTYRGGGLDHHLERLIPGVRTGRVVKGGATLARLLPLAEKEISEGGWDAVVLQDDLPETTVEAFLASAAAGADMVQSGGARAYLLETWPYNRLGWIDASGIEEAHRRAAAESGITVIPVGRSWLRTAEAHPDIDLLDTDREHPSVAGSWLAACTVAAVLTDGTKMPVFTVPPESLDTRIAASLLNMVRAVVRETG